MALPTEDNITNLETKREISASSTTNASGRSALFQDCCTLQTLRKRLPIIQWLPNYKLSTLTQDMLAGITVGLTAIPQGIAYAEVAGLGLEYGLYSGFMGCFVYLFLGSSKDVTIGPTAIMALMVNPYVVAGGPDFAVLMCFLSGCIIFLFGLLHLGFLVEFISFPVTSGFTCAAAITIGCSQIKNLLGISGKTNGFLETWKWVIGHIDEFRIWDFLLGICTIIFLLGLRKLKDFGSRRSSDSRTSCQNAWAKIFWLLSLGRNALAVIIGTAMAYIFSLYGQEPVRITGTVLEGLPDFGPPPFNTTYNGTDYNFIEMTKEMGQGIISIPLIAILESIAIAKAFAKGKTLDATQEMLALGMANIVGSFAKSMPVTGSFTRTAVNNASGVQTPFGGIFTGCLVLLALGLLTTAFKFIPKTTLSAVIISAMLFMLEIDAAILLWKTKKTDLIIFIVTVLACLFAGLEIGILVGIGVNLLFVMYATARPTVTIQGLKISNGDVILVAPAQSLQFPAAEYVREAVMEYCDINSLPARTTIVLDGANVLHIDATVAKNLKVLADDLQLRKYRIIFWRWSTSVTEICQNLDVTLGGLFVRASSLELAIGEWETHDISQNHVNDGQV